MATFRIEGFKFNPANWAGLDESERKACARFAAAREKLLNTITTTARRLIGGPFDGVTLEIDATTTSTAPITVGDWCGEYRAKDGESCWTWDGTTGAAPVNTHGTSAASKAAPEATGKGFDLFRDLLADLGEDPAQRATAEPTPANGIFYPGRVDDFGNDYSPNGRGTWRVYPPSFTKKGQRKVYDVELSHKDGNNYVDDFGDLFGAAPESSYPGTWIKLKLRATYTVGRTSYTIPATGEAVTRLRARLVKAKKWFSDKLLSPTRKTYSTEPAFATMVAPIENPAPVAAPSLLSVVAAHEADRKEEEARSIEERGSAACWELARAARARREAEQLRTIAMEAAPVAHAEPATPVAHADHAPDTPAHAAPLPSAAPTRAQRIAAVIADGGRVIGDALRTLSGQPLMTLTHAELATIPADKITPLAEHQARVHAYIAAHRIPADTAPAVKPAEPVTVDCADAQVDAYMQALEAEPMGDLSEAIAAIEQAQGIEPAELATVCAATQGAAGTVGAANPVPPQIPARSPQADHEAARATVAQRHVEQASAAPGVGGGGGRTFENEISPAMNVQKQEQPEFVRIVIRQDEIVGDKFEDQGFSKSGKWEKQTIFDSIESANAYLISWGYDLKDVEILYSEWNAKTKRFSSPKPQTEQAPTMHATHEAAQPAPAPAQAAPIEPAAPTTAATAQNSASDAPKEMEKRNIWIPNMTPKKLDRLLSKTDHSAEDLEDLRDFKYFLLTDQQSAIEKWFMTGYSADGGPVYVLKNKFWLTNIEAAISTEKPAPALPQAAPSDNPTTNGTGFAQQAASHIGAWCAAMYRNTQGAHVLRFDVPHLAPHFSIHETRAELMAELQASAEQADRETLSRFSALDCTGDEVRNMAPRFFAALHAHMESINYHTEALMLSCHRGGRDDLAAGLMHLAKYQAAPDNMGISWEMSEARRAIAQTLRTGTADPVSPEAQTLLESWGLFLWGQTPSEPPPGVGGAAHSILESAPGFSKVKPFTLDPCAILQAGVKAEQLVGLGVVYLGNAANAYGEGAITEATDTRGQSFGDLNIVCTLEDGRVIKANAYSFTGDLRPIFQFDGKMHGAPYLAQLAAVRASLKAQHSSAQAMAEAEHARQLETLAAEFPQLERPGKNQGGKLAAINMRKLLKQAFKGVKFSVTSDYNSARVGWADGPTVDQVQEVVGRFDIGHSDTQSDYFYTSETAFSALFGGVQYLTTRRDHTDQLITRAIAEAFQGREVPKDATPKDWRSTSGAFAWHTDSGQMYSRRVREILSKTPA